MAPAVGVLMALDFTTELLLWAGVAVAVHAAIGGWVGWTVGSVLAVVVIVAWSLWMAPRTRRRLPAVPRAIVAGAGCLAVGATLLAHGPRWWGVALLGGAVVMVVAELNPTRGAERTNG